jgi:hypothetical protein
MDWEILIRIAKRYPLEYIPEYMGCLREYGEAKTFSGGGRRFKELAAIMRKHGSLRYPPGYFTYGLDTYQKAVCDGIQNLTPGFLQVPSRKVQCLITYLAHRRIAKILRDSQGLYADGWAGPVLRYMLPPGAGTLRMSGSLPELSAGLRAQQLRIAVNGRVQLVQPLDFGAFALNLAVAEPENPVNVEVQASRFVVPSKVGLGPDPRRLSYVLDGIGWI